MKKSIEKDKKKRLSFLKYESCRRILKSVCYNFDVPAVLRAKAGLTLSALPKDSSYIQLRKRCILTGRGYFLLSPFNISRLMIRKLARNGYIPGLRKSSW